jgi:hypothetical protein
MKEHTYHILAASALFGVLVWLSISLRETYVVTISAPVEIRDVPEGWAVRTPLPRSVDLTCRGEGWRLLFLRMGPALNLSLSYFDLKTPAGAETGRGDSAEGKSVTVVSLDNLARTRFTRPGIDLVDISPNAFSLALDRYEAKRVPVILNLRLLYREGYGPDGTALLTPDSVTVGGAAAIVREIRSWPTVSDSLTNIRMPLDVETPLASAGNYDLVLSPQAIHVSVAVQPFAEKTIPAVVVEIPDYPRDREVILIPPKIDIIARAGIRRLSTLVPGDFRVSVEYRRILADSTGTIEALVIGPPDIQVVSRRPERLQYIVRKKL